MKRLSLMLILMLAGYVAFGQKRISNDPSYSINNYKHPNKVTDARKFNLDNVFMLETVTVDQPVNYKQPQRRARVKKTGIPMTTASSLVRKSYKHPQGL